jgi:hypothetical protein
MGRGCPTGGRPVRREGYCYRRLAVNERLRANETPSERLRSALSTTVTNVARILINLTPTAPSTRNRRGTSSRSGYSRA